MKKLEIDKAYQDIARLIIKYSNGVRTKTYGEITQMMKEVTFKAAKSQKKYASERLESFMLFLNETQKNEYDNLLYNKSIKATKYALLIPLLFESDESLTSQEITEGINKSKAYTTKITRKLERLNILRKSQVGRNNYYFLTVYGRELKNHFSLKGNLIKLPLKLQNEVKFYLENSKPKSESSSRKNRIVYN